MINAERILTTLDARLNHAVRLIIYGRAALALGFSDPPADTSRTLDVDAIIPMSEVDAFRSDGGFWDAQEGTNDELKKEGLYITHLFEANQVFLRKDWEEHLVPLNRPATRWLRLFRPATIDLILTKMMRGDDAQDMADVEFMVRHDRVAPEHMEAAFRDAIIPEIVDLQDAFKRAQPVVRKLVRDVSK